MNLQVGLKGSCSQLVTEQNTAKVIKSGNLDVLATPVVIALMEETAWKSVAPYLEEGQATVGTKMEMEHIAATPTNMRVWCEAELVEVDGRRLCFSITVRDEVELIARGKHERFIISQDRFLQKARGKKSP